MRFRDTWLCLTATSSSTRQTCWGRPLLGPNSTPPSHESLAILCRIPKIEPTTPFEPSRSAPLVVAGEEVVEVWTCGHIDTVVRGKAEQSLHPDQVTGYRGLGWSHEDAQTLVDELIYGLVDRSDGGTMGDQFPDGNPPLDHEDGKVYGACKALAWEDPLAQIYCVTRDRGFLQAYDNGSLSGHSRVMSPSTFVALVRASRTQYSMRRMAPPRLPDAST